MVNLRRFEEIHIYWPLKIPYWPSAFKSNLEHWEGKKVTTERGQQVEFRFKLNPGDMKMGILYVWRKQ